MVNLIPFIADPTPDKRIKNAANFTDAFHELHSLSRLRFGSLEEAGIKPGASQVKFYAVDGYRQTLSLEHVKKHGVFLAYEVYGQTLPPEHGYPLRLVDKGSYGSSWIKWLERIEVE